MTRYWHWMAQLWAFVYYADRLFFHPYEQQKATNSWWGFNPFQTFITRLGGNSNIFGMFTPDSLEKMIPIWRTHIFPRGLVQPPTRSPTWEESSSNFRHFPHLGKASEDVPNKIWAAKGIQHRIFSQKFLKDLQVEQKHQLIPIGSMLWYIYLHLIDIYDIHVGKYTVHGSYGIKSSEKPTIHDTANLVKCNVFFWSLLSWRYHTLLLWTHRIVGFLRL